MRGGLAERCELHVVTKEDVPSQPNVHVHRGIGPNSPELLRLFEEADVFVLPSLAECLAVVLMEATAAGLPVITTEVGALPEAVQPGESGLLVQAGDTPSLYRALETLAGDLSLRQRMGRRGYDLARRKFDAQLNNRALLDLVVEVATKQRRTRKVAS
jgi:glycosyltransferase involved in cell wall biosynthesis